MKKSTTPKLSGTHFSILGIVAIAAIVGGLVYLAKESKKTQMVDITELEKKEGFRSSLGYSRYPRRSLYVQVQSRRYPSSRSAYDLTSYVAPR